MREAKVNLKINKCEFGVKETNFLGHVVNGDSTKMQEEKVQAILQWPSPKNLKQLEKFKGFAGYYRQYISHFSDIIRRINEKLKKKEFTWRNEDEEIFQPWKR